MEANAIICKGMLSCQEYHKCALRNLCILIYLANIFMNKFCKFLKIKIWFFVIIGGGLNSCSLYSPKSVLFIYREKRKVCCVPYHIVTYNIFIEVVER